MKTSINILLSVCLVLLLGACAEEEAATPKAVMTIDKDLLNINESMIVNFHGVADQVVVYTGDETHDYELRNQNNTGFVVNKGTFSYSYTVPGTYKVVCVASTHTDGATDLKRDTCSYYVKVIDDQTEIDKLSCPQILYDEVFAEKLNESDWLMKLPRKVKYKTNAMTISLKQRLSFYIHSELTKVFIDGAEFSKTTKYDLENDLNIKVQSDFGTTRDYKLFTIYYPEFKSMSIAGVEGTLVRNEFEYDSFVYEFKLPAGTDVSNVVPEFTLSGDGEKAYIGEAEQISGATAVDFTKPVTYRLIGTDTENPDVKAVSNVEIKIVFE